MGKQYHSDTAALMLPGRDGVQLYLVQETIILTDAEADALTSAELDLMTLDDDSVPEPVRASFPFNAGDMIFLHASTAPFDQSVPITWQDPPATSGSPFAHVDVDGKTLIFDTDCVVTPCVEMTVHVTTDQSSGVQFLLLGTAVAHGWGNEAQDSYSSPKIIAPDYIGDIKTFPPLRVLAGDTLQMYLHAVDPSGCSNQGISLSLVRGGV